MVLEVNSDVVRGSIFGALIGDAAGTYLEFLGRLPTNDELDKAMRLKGGGFFQVAPGQFTDDGEMTTALLTALAISSGRFDQNEVAKQYRHWALSHPFDMGSTTTNAIGSNTLRSQHLAQQILSRAEKWNMTSKANGSLMRATPLALAATQLSLPETIEMVAQDVKLTHPNPSCVISTTAYVLAIRHLILHPKDHLGAIQVMNDYLQPLDSEVMDWFTDARQGNLPPAYPLAGFVRYGFTYATYHLIQASSFEVAIRETLQLGGDTDTNACIVGGLVGAFHGFKNLPTKMVKQLLSCDLSKGKQPRPSQFTIYQVIHSLEELGI